MVLEVPVLNWLTLLFLASGRGANGRGSSRWSKALTVMSQRAEEKTVVLSSPLRRWRRREKEEQRINHHRNHA
jgi:hypothetical protein